jgi:hypothetical protein
LLDPFIFDRDGFAITEPILNSTETADLISIIERNTTQNEKRGGILTMVIEYGHEAYIPAST